VAEVGRASLVCNRRAMGLPSLARQRFPSPALPANRTLDLDWVALAANLMAQL
jgi:hypothetical protein